jgi:hypothetical protein
LGEVLNAVSLHYAGSTTLFQFQADAGGAISLLYVLDDGLKAEDARRERRMQGRLEPDDYRPREI